MTERIVDLSESPARLSVRYQQLRIERPDQPLATIPLAELAVLAVAHRQVTYTHSVLAELAAAGGALVVCDAKCLPVGMMLPLAGHSIQTQRFAAQARATIPLRKRLWRQLIRSKIRSQAATLRQLTGDDAGLLELAPRVRSGDATNIEAQASRRYWPRLFGDPHFRRDPERKDQNLLLNYGYAILRAIVGRAICASGLHPSLGIHHHNKYNPYCLADDLMEPFRPLVDLAVARFLQTNGPVDQLNTDVKLEILTQLTGRLNIDGCQRTLFDAVSRLTASLAEAYLARTTKLTLPSWS